jgi:hypothetical protein
MLNTFINSKLSDARCVGCKQLECLHSFHNHISELQKADILFVLPSYDKEETFPTIFGDFLDPHDIIVNFCVDLGVTCEFTVASKCPEDDLDKDAVARCRQYLDEDIEKVQPKLIIPMGNLALQMTLKGKSGIGNKRGVLFHRKEDNIPVVPTYSIIDRINDPDLVLNDIYLAIRIVIKGVKGAKPVEFSRVRSLEELKERISEIKNCCAVDIETEGLDILNHKVLTVSVTHEEGTFAVPVYHKESDLDGAEVMKIFGDFLENPDVTKVFHNSNFDLSFWIREGYLPQNIEDTLILAYLENENRPNSLRELTKRYFPDEIEEL